MNNPVKNENIDVMSIYQKSENILTDIQNIIETSQRKAYHAVDTILSQRNFITVCDSIKSFLRLSTQCVDNLIYD